jgi:extracellular elastinolytic metalloproteinase
VLRFGGANQKELWLGYARRGFGANAAGGNLLTNSDLDPVPDFEPVGTKPATVRFSAENASGDPVNARIYVGHYEVRLSPIADTNPATPAAGTAPTVVNFDDTARFAPGTYEFVAHAPGYGHVRFRERFRSGERERIEIEFPTNWASSSSGATATTADGGTVGSLIDDLEGTNWAANATNTAGDLSVDGKQATIDLGGSDPVRVRYVQVSAHVGPGATRFAALRQFELWACNADSADCSTDAGYTRVYTSAANAFPGDAPRPVAPHLILRRFDVHDFRATHIRFVVRSTQCTGGPAYQGDQDADPANNPDCDTNVPANSTRNFARTAEFQAFSRSPEIDD